jgi:hypothetical protein
MWRGKRKKSPNNYGIRRLRDIFPVQATINVDMTVAAQTSELESEDDGDEACKVTVTRSVSTSTTAFAAANATTTEESSEDDDDDDLINYTLQIPSTATSFKRNCSMLKDPTEVFEAVVNEYDKKPPLPLNWTRLGKPPSDSFDVVENQRGEIRNENLQLRLPGDC